MTALSAAAAQALDALDPLAPIRELFELPDDVIFMDANSVGPMPKAARGKAKGLLDDWVNLRRRGWSQRQWLEMPSLLGDCIAPLIGAGPGEVVMCDSTTLNQFKAVSHALTLRPERRTLLTQNGNFPTDVHVLQGIAAASEGRLSLRFVDSEDEAVAAMDAEVAVAALSHVDYRSGGRWDMGRVTAAAHAKGVLTVWDVSHSAGAVPVDVRGADADFAVGCGYKYLCAGPGGPAFIYVKRGLGDEVWPALAGWMGHADVYAFARDYAPHGGVKKFLTGTPLVGADELASAMLDVWPKVDPAKLWAKHKSLTDFLIAALKQECGSLGVVVNSPGDHGRRGGNVSFSSPGAGSVVEALIDAGVVSSFRQPDAIRFGVSPLVIRHADCWEAVARLKRVLAETIWRQPKYAKVSV
ncbi:MAG: aminotransferase class V-fold PLP-dependent enzyme [Rhizobiales bacterium]|nr:aminotransferase class V-fold PLP-dependent enzyme [Hyphomicrobiales bacterium]